MNTKTLSVGDEVRVLWANVWMDGDVIAVHECEPVIAFGTNNYQAAKYFTAIEPRVSEEDAAVEEMLKDSGITNTVFHAPVMRTLYRAGYRKQPPVDMDDPANWRAGDVVKPANLGVLDTTYGCEYTIKEMRGNDVIVIDDDEDVNADRDADMFRFVRRTQ